MKAQSAYEEGLEAFKKIDYPLAMDRFTEAIRLNPQDARAYNRRAVVFELTKDYNSALADHDKAISIRPDARFFMDRAGIYSLLNQEDKAIADCSEALRVVPPLPQAWVQRINLYRGKAFKIFADQNQKLLVSNPKMLADWRVARFNEEKSDRGLSSIADVLKANPKNVRAWQDGNEIFWLKGEYAKAVHGLNKALQFDPGSEEVMEALAWLLATCPVDEIRDGKKALVYATKANSLSAGKHPTTLDTLAAAHAENGDQGQAAQWEENSSRWSFK